MISIQIRLYNTDLSFRETLQMDSATPEHVKFTSSLIAVEVAGHDPGPFRKPLNFCNMMVRRDGKLVSYKGFM